MPVYFIYYTVCDWWMMNCYRHKKMLLLINPALWQSFSQLQLLLMLVISFLYSKVYHFFLLLYVVSSKKCFISRVPFLKKYSWAWKISSSVTISCFDVLKCFSELYHLICLKVSWWIFWLMIKSSKPLKIWIYMDLLRILGVGSIHLLHSVVWICSQFCWMLQGISFFISLTSFEVSITSFLDFIGNWFSFPIIHSNLCIRSESTLISYIKLLFLVPMPAIIFAEFTQYHSSTLANLLISISLFLTYYLRDLSSLLTQCRTIWLSVNLSDFWWWLQKAILTTWAV